MDKNAGMLSYNIRIRMGLPVRAALAMRGGPLAVDVIFKVGRNVDIWGTKVSRVLPSRRLSCEQSCCQGSATEGESMHWAS